MDTKFGVSTSCCSVGRAPSEWRRLCQIWSSSGIEEWDGHVEFSGAAREFATMERRNDDSSGTKTFTESWRSRYHNARMCVICYAQDVRCKYLGDYKCVCRLDCQWACTCVEGHLWQESPSHSMGACERL